MCLVVMCLVGHNSKWVNFFYSYAYFVYLEGIVIIGAIE